MNLLALQKLVDEMQQAVYAPQGAEGDLLRDVAAEYAEACQSVNNRLWRAGELLRQGLRSEALQEAERKPALLDLVALLDFPELAAWRQLLQQWGLAQPPALAMEWAAELNEAYAEQQPLEGLLSKHRLFALARAPLPARIAILRRIYALDPHNPAWQTDLELLEKARLKQIAGEMEAAFRQRKLATLADLSAELRAPDWLTERPAKLVERAERLQYELEAHAACDELEKLIEPLNRAYTEFDVAAGRTARNDWRHYLSIAALPADDPRLEQVAPVIDWLAEQDALEAAQEQHAATLAHLERALDEPTPRDALEKLYHAALRHEEGLPPALLSRYRQRMSSFDLDSRRKHRLILAAIVGSVLLVGGGITALVVQQQHLRAVETSAQGLAKLLDADELDEAQGYYAALEQDVPHVAASPSVQELRARLEGALREEDERRAAFAAALERAEQAGPETPDQDSLTLARNMARSDTEKSRVAQFESQVAAARRRQQKERDDKFMAGLNTLREQIAQFELLPHDDERLSPTRLSQLNSEVRSLMEGGGLITPALHAQGKPLALRVQALQEHHATLRERARLQAAITEAVGNVDRFEMQLKAFAEKNPELAAAQQFQQVVAEAPLWQAMERWRVYFTAAEWNALSSLTPARAAELLAEGKALHIAHGGLPPGTLFAARQPYLQQIARRPPQQVDEVRGKLEALFRDPLVARLWIVEKQSGERYYVSDEPRFAQVNDSSPVAISYIAGFDLSTRRTGIVPKDVSHTGRAPQSLLSQQVQQPLQQLSAANWELSFARLLQLIHEQPDMDPILRLILMQRVIEAAVEGSPVFAEAYARQAEILRNTPTDVNVKWMLPSEATATAARLQAVADLDGLPSLTTAEQQMLAALTAQSRPPEHQFRWIGWLDRDAQGAWRCQWPRPVEGTGDIFIVRPAGGSTRVASEVVGQLRQGQVTWTNASESALLPGRPLYLRLLNSPATTVQR